MSPTSPPDPAFEPKRERTIKVRVSDAEHDALRARCPRPHLAAWIRDVALGAPPARRSREAAPAVDPGLLRQLAGVGNLLNQLARGVHRGEWTAADRVQVLARLAAAERELAAIRAAHERGSEHSDPASETSDVGGASEATPAEPRRPTALMGDQPWETRPARSPLVPAKRSRR